MSSTSVPVNLFSLATCFGLTGRLPSQPYRWWGVGLMAFKYAVEACTVGYFTDRFYTPLDFVNPLLSAREQFTSGAPAWLGMAWVLWTLPFVWIAVGMSSRRALDAGKSPWLGMLMLVPLLNFLTMIYLALVPSADATLPEVKDEEHLQQEVWDTVVDFPEITTPPAWFFRMGIASPVRAQIEGSGVGAVRRCEFTTGAFVERITVWDEPHRLAFDVTEQPDPTYELTPYRHIHPPHLDGAFRSTRGEFRLIALPDGGTRLEGRTWYQLEIYPLGYWTLWTDWLVHQIHRRVLQHTKDIAESSP